MTRPRLLLFALILSARAAVGAEPDGDRAGSSKLGFYPLCENTGSVLGRGHAHLAGATSVFTSTNFVSRLDNTRGALWLVPVGTSLSWYPAASRRSTPR